MPAAVGPTAVAQTAQDAAAERAEQEVMRRARAAARRESAEPTPPAAQTAPSGVQPAPTARPDRPPTPPPATSAVIQPRPAVDSPPVVQQRQQQAPTASVSTAPAAVTISPAVFAQVWRRAFARPATPPSPPDNPLTEARIALGARLFAEKRLSSDHKSSCASCHDPARGFMDGRPRAIGKKGLVLARNTPALWNLAWARRLGWDGASTTLESAVKAEIERDDAMDATLEAGALWASRDPAYSPLFARAFPDRPQPSPRAVADALSSYVRSITSPNTRFDQWVGGEDAALSAEEKAGLEVFTGKGQCVSCHSGWRLTDDSLHPSAKGSIKTPSLREVVWTAPYGVDGSVATLAAFLQRHGKAAAMNGAERDRLVAFLRAVSSDKAPREAGSAAR